MRLPTIVNAYIHAAMKRALVERLDDGTLAATIPEAFGVVAFGTDQLELGADLYARLEDWVGVSRSKGYILPVIDDIDLNSEDGQALAAYHKADPTPIANEIFENEQEFEAALDRWAKRPE